MTAIVNKPSFTNVLKTGLIAGAIAAAANVVLYLAGGLVDRMTFPFPMVIITSMLFIVLGSLVYFGLSRVLGSRTNLVFTIVSLVFLAAFAFGPINAMSQEPMPGAGLFNFASMIVAQIMHLIAGAIAVIRLRSLM